jgi:hypothetical protein
LLQQSASLTSQLSMKSDKAIATYQRLREGPLWRLLAAKNGPVVIALLQTHLLERERSIPASLLFERLREPATRWFD